MRDLKLKGHIASISLFRLSKAFAEADHQAAEKVGPSLNGGNSTSLIRTTPLLEKKWTAIPRLQKKVLELERQAAHNAKIHAHRVGVTTTGGSGSGGADGTGGAGQARRMLPRHPCSHTLKGHSSVVTCVKVHPVFTVVVSGSEDGRTIKVRKTRRIRVF